MLHHGDKRNVNFHYDPTIKSLAELILGMRINRSNEEEAEIQIGCKILLFQRKVFQKLRH